MTTDVDFLARVPIFSRLKRENLMRLAENAQHLVFGVGDEIIKEGDHGKRLYVIVRGTAAVIKSRGDENERRLATFAPNDFFGEMALIDDLVRSATVIALEETEVFCIDQMNLRQEIGKEPSIALELLRMLSQRVRALEKCLMHTLGGLLPICINCKNIRDEGGSWIRIEDYVADRSEADFTHGICPECHRKLYPQHFQHEE